MSNTTLVEWEDRRRAHMNSAVALLLGLSSASLAFCASLLQDDSVLLGGGKTFVFLAAVFCFTCTIISSLGVAFTRLQDARSTVRTIRAKGKDVASDYVADLRDKSRIWGVWTWRLLYMQLSSFSVGAILLIILVGVLNQKKIFPEEPEKANKTQHHKSDRVGGSEA